MIEARVFIKSLDQARKVVKELDADYAGDYAITDVIYRRLDGRYDIDKEFLRLRAIEKTIWPGERFVLAIKHTKAQPVGKLSHIPLKKTFKSEDDMRQWYTMHLADEYVHDFSFSRVGWQYNLSSGEQIDLELNESWPTIEFKAETQKQLRALLHTFSIDPNDVVHGPSVVTMRKLLQNKSIQ